MAKSFELKIICPDQPSETVEVTSIDLCTQEGAWGILADHEPMILQLADGKVSYLPVGSTVKVELPVRAAYFSFINNRANLLTRAIPTDQ